MKLIVGNTYSVTRITGKTIYFKVLEYDPQRRCLTLEDLNCPGIMAIDPLSDAELESIRPYKP